MQTVVILFHYGRCGSTVLADLLGQHMAITSLGEIFNERVDLPGTLHKYLPASDIPIRRTDNAALTLAEAEGLIHGLMMCSNDESSSNFIVLEIKQYDFDRGVFRFGLSDLLTRLNERYRVKLVLLERLNLVDRFLSEMLAQVTRVYHRSPESEPIPGQRLSIDGDALEIYIYHNAVMYLKNRMLLTGVEHLSLTYEADISSSPLIAYYRVCAFLGVEPVDVTVRFGLTTNRNKHELIDNYNQILQRLSIAGMEFFLTGKEEEA